MMRILIACCLLVVLCTRQAPARPLDPAQAVLEKLYQSNGNYVFLKPQIEWSSDTRSVAAFKRRSNTILLEKKAYQVCRSFGRDSLSALAFILGHELSHSYQEEGWNLAETNFLAHGYTLNSSQAMEKNADVGGAFMAYLAGYATLDLLPDLLDRLYDAYGLKSKALAGYPPLPERMAAGREVQTLTQELVQVFETGGLLSVAGQYELASACFTFVEKHYKGREVYNNTGVNRTLQAINFTETTPDAYAYPIELEWQTRLKKPRTSRGEEGLSAADRALRRRYLTEARRDFETARKMNSRDFTAELNLFCTILLIDGGRAALRYYDQSELMKKAQLTGASLEQRENLQIARCIALAQSGKVSEARRILTDLAERSQFSAVRLLAETNLARTNDQKPATEAFSCNLPFSTSSPVDGIRLNRPPISANLLAVSPDIQVSMVVQKVSTAVVFLKNGRPVLALQRIAYRKPQAKPQEEGGLTVLADAGSLRFCPYEKVILRWKGANDILEEWVKVYAEF